MEKQSEPAEEKPADPNTSEKQSKLFNKQLAWVIFGMVAILAVFFGAQAYFQSFNHFSYEGLSFAREIAGGTKTAFVVSGGIPFYHHYYHFRKPDGSTVKYNLYLRIDPRENKVPINGNISFIKGQKTYISVNASGLQCENATIAIAGLASFLNDNQIQIKGASPDPKIAEDAKSEVVTCDTHPETVVIIIQAGNETRIDQTTKTCYVITAANCEILQATEKFIVQTILDAKGKNQL